MKTTKDFLEEDESGVYNEQDISRMMIEHTKQHAVAILKVLSKTETEYQYNLNYVYPLSKIK